MSTEAEQFAAPRWTAETEELATDVLMQGYGRLIGRPGITHDVRGLLTALADAGVLTRQEIDVVVEAARAYAAKYRPIPGDDERARLIAAVDALDGVS